MGACAYLFYIFIIDSHIYYCPIHMVHLRYLRYGRPHHLGQARIRGILPHSTCEPYTHLIFIINVAEFIYIYILTGDATNSNSLMGTH